MMQTSQDDRDNSPGAAKPEPCVLVYCIILVQGHRHLASQLRGRFCWDGHVNHRRQEHCNTSGRQQQSCIPKAKVPYPPPAPPQQNSQRRNPQQPGTTPCMQAKNCQALLCIRDASTRTFPLVNFAKIEFCGIAFRTGCSHSGVLTAPFLFRSRLAELQNPNIEPRGASCRIDYNHEVCTRCHRE